MKSEREFIDALNQSGGTVAMVASWMMLHGCDVMIRPTLIRPDFESRNKFADSGDLEIRLRVEVKQRSIAFTSVEDYPYPTVFVDEVFKVDRIKKGALWGYIIINAAKTHACCVKSETRKHWKKIVRFDNKDGQERSFYVCEKRLCHFCRLMSGESEHSNIAPEAHDEGCFCVSCRNE